MRDNLNKISCDGCFNAVVYYDKEQEFMPYFVAHRDEDWMEIDSYHFCPECVRVIKWLHGREAVYKLGLLDPESPFVKWIFGEEDAWKDAEFAELVYGNIPLPRLVKLPEKKQGDKDA